MRNNYRNKLKSQISFLLRFCKHRSDVYVRDVILSDGAPCKLVVCRLFFLVEQPYRDVSGLPLHGFCQCSCFVCRVVSHVLELLDVLLVPLKRLHLVVCRAWLEYVNDRKSLVCDRPFDELYQVLYLVCKSPCYVSCACYYSHSHRVYWLFKGSAGGRRRLESFFA